MKALTIGGAMIDTIAIIANNRIERMTRPPKFPPTSAAAR
jgi:hypothetical protein